MSIENTKSILNTKKIMYCNLLYSGNRYYNYVTFLLICVKQHFECKTIFSQHYKMSILIKKIIYMFAYFL